MRPLTEIIVHCTATPEGRAVSVKEIDTWHRARGWSGIGYHRVIDLNGDSWQGRDLASVGAHCAGHNLRTIGVVYVGGLSKDGKTAKDTRTLSQKEGLIAELTNLRDRFNIQKVSGHNEYAAKACPCFNASAEYDHLFPEGRGIVVSKNPDGLLRRGDAGPDVHRWREDLDFYRDKIGHPYPVPLTGPFDHTLELVTMWFQKERGIQVDGIVGPQVLEEMKLALQGKPPFLAMPDNDEKPDTATALYHAEMIVKLLKTA
ncbi:N-acetylmuramoyl-L-alanine amidase [Roseibium sp. TrichSKD4]|uniref:peptidoglycan recognition protein family protein n=1 Tax=Roseibium sp. TrichSKD4 TaxID=744980 RepID=UPI0001E56B98|nr:peptidoglycan-binding domain-containing protein [Roseibium sp. TrichSKD4]EFO32630.1 N-acetylmuramoyl-L-alanine amidase [Roseibium sp. TrichSKD4]